MRIGRVGDDGGTARVHGHYFHRHPGDRRAQALEPRQQAEAGVDLLDPQLQRQERRLPGDHGPPGEPAGREGQVSDEARRDLLVRERSEWLRYKALYGIEFADRSPYHLVIDTSRWEPTVIVGALERLVRGLRPASRAR